MALFRGTFLLVQYDRETVNMGAGFWGMAKSGGGKMQAAGHKRAAATEPTNKGARMAQDRDKAAQAQETERLRAELALERKRVETLEDANHRVTERLDAAIQSVKAMLASKG
jgi:hypothetical protein